MNTIHSFAKIGHVKGKRAPSKRKTVSFGQFLSKLPTTPLVDAAPDFNYPMDGNDRVGDCVVAAVDHARQVITGLLTTKQENFTQNQIWDFYKTQNPAFNPKGTATTNGPGSSADGGMDVQTFLEYLVSKKLILGFAAIDHTNDAEMKAAIYLGLGVITGVVLDEAQMGDQFSNGLWDYVKGSPVDGGHCIPLVGYDATHKTCITWARLVNCTPGFILKQMDEAWFILTQFHVNHPGFRNHFDLAGFSQAIREITAGKVVIPTISTVPDTAVLKLGSKGQAVTNLQNNLNAIINAQLTVDGKFGKATQLAVIEFQTDYNLFPDGIVGPITQERLQSLGVPPPSTPLLSAIIEIESGGDDNAEGDKTLAHHAYGCLQIRQGVCDTVNAKFHTTYQAQQCLGSRATSLDIWNKYWQVFTAIVTNEDRARSWNGGPGWRQIYFKTNKTSDDLTYCKNLDIYWNKVKALL